MTQSPPVQPPSAALIERAPHLDLAPRPVRDVLLALGCALVWPIVLGALGWSLGLLSPEAPGDLVLLLGGFTVLILLPIAYFLPQLFESTVLILVPVLWLSVVLIMPYLLRFKSRRRSRLLLLLGFSACFGLAQALMGLLMLATKNV